MDEDDANRDTEDSDDSDVVETEEDKKQEAEKQSSVDIEWDSIRSFL